MNSPSRAKDDAVLAMLSARLKAGSGQVAAQLGVSSAHVRTATNRVRDEDIAQAAHGGLECPQRVAAAYAWGA